MVGLVVSNLLYPVIAVGVAAILCVIVVVRHRRPKSVEANMRAFHNGLRALAPESNPSKPPMRSAFERPADQLRAVHRLPAADPASPSAAPPASPPVRVRGTARVGDPVEGAEADTG